MVDDYQSQSNQKKDKSGIDIAVLIFGILSMLMIPFTSIIGIIMYFFSSKTSTKAIIGLILSILSIIIYVFLIILFISLQTTNVSSEDYLIAKGESLGYYINPKITTHIQTNSIIASDTSDRVIDAGVDTIEIEVQGTENISINLENLTILMATDKGVQLLTYSGDESYSNSKYGVSYKNNKEKSKNDISKNDIILFKYVVDYNISRRDLVVISYSIKDNQSLSGRQAIRTDFKAPEIMKDVFTQLYP